MKELGLLFLGIGIGSLNPDKSMWSWIICISIATIFIGLDYYFEERGKR